MSDNIDKWLCKAFAVLLMLVNGLFISWFVAFKLAISKLKKKEIAYMNMFNETANETLKITRSHLNL